MIIEMSSLELKLISVTRTCQETSKLRYNSETTSI